MAKIDLNTVSSGYLSQAALNANFTAIEDEFQNKVLYRDNPNGEPNSMQSNLDMNGYYVLNAGNTSLVDADNIAYTADGTGAETRTIGEKLNDVVSVKDFGAVGDGVTDDTAAIQAALVAGSSIYFPYGQYLCKDIVIGTHQSAYCNGSIFKPSVGASYIFKLEGFKPALFNAYFDGTSGNVPSAIGVNSYVIVQDSQFPSVGDCHFQNTTIGLTIGGAATEVKKGIFSNLIFDTFSSRGVYVGKNANTCTFSNFRLYSGTVVGGGGQLPKAGVIGFQVVGTSSTTAYGGHLISNVDCEESQYGFVFTDANLCILQNCIGDSLGNAAYQFNGFCNWMKLDNCFAGTCLRGFEVNGTSVNIWITNPTTILIGNVPSWGGTGFYDAGTPYGMISQNSAAISIGGAWSGDASGYTVFASGSSTLNFDQDEPLHVGTTGTVAAASTVFLTFAGANATEFPTVITHKPGVIYGLITQNGTAPGVGQSFTYTIRKNFADTGVIATVAGAGVFAGSSNAIQTFSANENITIKLVTSGTAAASTHRAVMKVRFFG